MSKSHKALVGLYLVVTVMLVLLIVLLFDVGSHFDSLLAHSRQEGCEAAEKLRGQNRANVKREERELPVNLKLLPAFNNPTIIRLSRERWARELAQNAPVDCIAYGRKVALK